MSTNGTVKFVDKRGRYLLNLYNHYDSYYSGLGELIYEFFSDEKNFGNGFEDTILLFLCFIKEGKPYRVYATDEKDIQEYNYTIYETEDGLRFSIKREGKIVNMKMTYRTKLEKGTLTQFRKELDTEKL